MISSYRQISECHLREYPAPDHRRQNTVSSADGHQLISILLEELVNLLDDICAIHAHGDVDTYIDQQVMAQSILQSLMLSLDLKSGDALADDLHDIYGHLGKLMRYSEPGSALPNARAAYHVIVEISEAWHQSMPN